VTAATTIRAELASAMREVNDAFNRLPEDRQPEVTGYDALDRNLDAACISGDLERARRAIADWRAHWLAEFERRAEP